MTERRPVRTPLGRAPVATGKPVSPAAKPPAAAPAKPEPRSTPGELALRRDMPLVPISSIAGRALVTVIAIMTFLGALTAGAAVLLAGASQEWRQSVTSELTLQVRPVPGRDIDAEVAKAAALARATPGIAEAVPFDRQEGERLLEPWLGQGLDLKDLPIPRLVVLKLAGGARPDIAALRKALDGGVAGASLDDHRLWLERLAAMANTVVGIALVILALVLAAMGLAVGFATRGAMAGNREIIGVLHFVGADDRFIAAEFQYHFLRLGLRGGGIGGGAAVAVFLLASGLQSRFGGSAGADQLEALFGAFSLGVGGCLAIAAVVGLVASIAALVSRGIVRQHLRELA